MIIASLGYSQKIVKKNPIPTIPSISNLKLGLIDDEIINKYGPAIADTTTNSTRVVFYNQIKLDNNYIINSISFRFFKKKLFQIFFTLDNDIDSGLSSKYGYEEIDESTGVYGNFKGNIRFFKVTKDDESYCIMINDQIRKLSESEGF
jgi:hypothetical protein